MSKIDIEQVRTALRRIAENCEREANRITVQDIEDFYAESFTVDGKPVDALSLSWWEYDGFRVMIDPNTVVDESDIEDEE